MPQEPTSKQCVVTRGAFTGPPAVVVHDKTEASSTSAAERQRMGGRAELLSLTLGTVWAQCTVACRMRQSSWWPKVSMTAAAGFRSPLAALGSRAGCGVRVTWPHHTKRKSCSRRDTALSEQAGCWRRDTASSGSAMLQKERHSLMWKG